MAIAELDDVTGRGGIDSADEVLHALGADRLVPRQGLPASEVEAWSFI